MNYISSEGLNWRGLLKGFPKATNLMQPLFEAFTNSLEAIDLRKKRGDDFSPYIHVDFYFNETIEQENDGLSRLVITDNGIGFDDENFTRLKIFKDDSKGYDNRGSERIQLIHSFQTATYESVYLQGAIYKYRKFILSKAEAFLANHLNRTSIRSGYTLLLINKEHRHFRCIDNLLYLCLTLILIHTRFHL